MAKWLRVLAVFVNNVGLVPIAHNGWLTTTRNSSSRESDYFSPPKVSCSLYLISLRSQFCSLILHEICQYFKVSNIYGLKYQHFHMSVFISSFPYQYEDGPQASSNDVLLGLYFTSKIEHFEMINKDLRWG